MPCYTVQLTSVVFKAKHVKVLLEALKRLKWNASAGPNDLIDIDFGTIDLKNEKITCRKYDEDKVNQLKREYSAVVLEQVAKKKRWVLKKESATKAILRRY